jgi:hypothetical protein
VAIEDRLRRLEAAYPDLCEPRPCKRIAWAERTLLPGGREELVGDPPPTLCDSCPELDNPAPPINYIVVVRDCRGGDFDPYDLPGTGPNDFVWPRDA